jgi:hypothetical protein
MTHIYKHRGTWRYRDANGKLCKFATEAEAKSSLGTVGPEEVEDASEKEESSPKKKKKTYKSDSKKDTTSKSKKI